MENGKRQGERSEDKNTDMREDIESMVLCGEDEQDTQDRNKTGLHSYKRNRRVMCGESTVRRSPVPPQRR